MKRGAERGGGPPTPIDQAGPLEPRRHMRPSRTVFERLLMLILILYALALVREISTHPDRYQWDFRSQYQAGRIFADGGDPYDLVYAYPPVTLYFYRVFACLEYGAAFQLFLGFKCTLLIGLVVFWKRVFLPREGGALFYLFCLLAFNSALWLDMRAGNMNLFEILMIWIAFWFYLHERPVLFCACLFAAALFKITPLFFLVLLFLREDRKRLVYIGGTLICFGMYLLLQYVAMPSLFVRFLENVFFVLQERGVYSPSTSALIKDVFRWLASETGIVVPPPVPLVAFAAATALIVWVTYRAYLVLRGVRSEDEAKTVVFVTCVMYALVHPRFKDYAYVLLVVPTYFIMARARFARVYPFLFLIVVLFSRNPAVAALPGMDGLLSVAWQYGPLLVVFAIWGLYLYEIFAMEREELKRGRSPNGT
jgi:hypothetical protein